jgi:hypothetical protein
MNFPLQRIGEATNIFKGLAYGTPTTPGMPLTTSPLLAGAQGLASLYGQTMPISNVIGDVVKGAGSILSEAFKGGSTPTGGGIFGGFDNPYDYYRSSRGGEYGGIYGSEGSF